MNDEHRHYYTIGIFDNTGTFERLFAWTQVSTQEEVFKQMVAFDIKYPDFQMKIIDVDIIDENIIDKN